MPDKIKELNITHLFWTIVVATALTGVAWGVIRNQVGVNKDEIEKKLSKEVFEEQRIAQTQQFESLEGVIDKGFERMGKRLEVIEKK